MCAAHDLPNSHKNLRNVLPVAGGHRGRLIRWCLSI
jgi:hypothetical protein